MRFANSRRGQGRQRSSLTAPGKLVATPMASRFEGRRGKWARKSKLASMGSGGDESPTFCTKRSRRRDGGSRPPAIERKLHNDPGECQEIQRRTPRSKGIRCSRCWAARSDHRCRDRRIVRQAGGVRLGGVLVKVLKEPCLPPATGRCAVDAGGASRPMVLKGVRGNDPANRDAIADISSTFAVITDFPEISGWILIGVRDHRTRRAADRPHRVDFDPNRRGRRRSHDDIVRQMNHIVASRWR